MTNQTKAAGTNAAGPGAAGDRRIRLHVDRDPATGKLVANAPRQRPAVVELPAVGIGAPVRVLGSPDVPAAAHAAIRSSIEAVAEIVNVREARSLSQQMKPGEVRIVAPGRRKQITPEATVTMRMDMLDALLEAVGTPAPGLADLFAPRPDLPAAPALEAAPRRSRRPAYDL